MRNKDRGQTGKSNGMIFMSESLKDSASENHTIPTYPSHPTHPSYRIANPPKPSTDP
jgi:hypothetical protein